MRLVLDTNVLFAAFATPGACYTLFKHVSKKHRVVTSDFLLRELREKLGRKLKLPPQEVEHTMYTVRTRSVGVRPEALPAPVCRDPDDDWVLATAVTGECRCIVTGDRDLLVLGSYEGIAIIPPAGFWAFEADHPES